MLGGWIVNVSCCQQRVESDRPDRADGRGQWTGQLWHTSLSATHIHLIINVFQLVANKTQVRGRQAVLSGGRRQANSENNMDKMNICAHVPMPRHTFTKHTHTRIHTKPVSYLWLGAQHWSRPRRAYFQPHTGTFLCQTGSSDWLTMPHWQPVYAPVDRERPWY